MKRIYLLMFLGVVTVFAACKQQNNGADSQMEAVVAVHDELMPKMVEITRLQEQLTSTIPDSVRTQAQNATISDLEKAHDAMMSWMREFGQAFDFEEITQGKSLTEAKKDSLNKYEESVMALRDQMLSAIEKGQKTFDALKQE